MAVGAGDTAVGAGTPTGAGTRRPSRRDLARGLLASAAALALTPVIAASRPLPPGDPSDAVFDETYRGRHIQGYAVPSLTRRAGEGDWQITVDGSPLHLMRRADGTWMSMVDHYTSYPTPLEATRAAVDELGPGRHVRDLAPGPVGAMRHSGGGTVRPGGMTDEMAGGSHGVHA
ncbi:tyrosinase family oxidase copper chaperone [Streptomyces sp. LaPpAH-108]|uniref:tyrosinase family oxidase copper chaperone n=1 Tax=Streptomyces sp. LaPpAH-108 TaxID=1155714 RepID=UPI0003652540|nr:tyrosinase family oxidase copper chaperone [Streptomyces sp. LaPpAH-108]